MKQALLGLLLTLGLVACGAQTDQPARSGKVVTSGTAQIGGPWELIDQTGTVRTDQDFLGKPTLIYFGFAFCPDVCPTSLQKMGAIAGRVDPKGEQLNYLFFTIDPERDTPEVLSQYVTANGFAPGLVGLTGEREAVEAAQAAFKIYASKVEDEQSTADYLYDHTDYILILNESGTYHSIVRPDESVDAAAAALKADFGLR